MCSVTCHVIKRNYRGLLFFASCNLRQDLSVPYKQFSSIYHNRVMPRSVEHMLGMQRMRQKIKEKSAKYTGNGKVSLQVGITLNEIRLDGGDMTEYLTNLPLADSGQWSLWHITMCLSNSGSHQVYFQLWRRDAEVGI